MPASQGGKEAVLITPILQALTATRVQGPRQYPMLTLGREAKNLPATYPFRYPPPWDLPFAFTECFPAAVMGAEDAGTLNLLRFRVSPSPTSRMRREAENISTGVSPRLVKRASCPLAGHPASAGQGGPWGRPKVCPLPCTLGEARHSGAWDHTDRLGIGHSGGHEAH